MIRDSKLLDEAARIYGFRGGLPDLVTLTPRQFELIQDIAAALAVRDARIAALQRALEAK